MKKLLFTVFGLSLVLSSFTPIKSTSVEIVIVVSQFNDGWGDGYCEGWRDVKGQNAICPISPIAPIPPIGCTYDSYKCGYNLGFKAGYKAASK